MASERLLSGKVCLITGTSHGIGTAIAHRYAENGAKLVLVARSADKLKEVADECSKKGAEQCDIRSVNLLDGHAVDQLCQDVIQQHGAVDVLVNNAGMMVEGTPLKGDPDEWAKMVALNQLVPMRFTRRLAPAMAQRKSGVIVNICSVAGLDATGGQAAYSASKWGARGWSNSCYQALRGENIKVMAIHPAYVNTPMVNGSDKLIPERMIQPSDVAEMAMLPFVTSGGCVPQEVTLRLGLSAYKEE